MREAQEAILQSLPPDAFRPAMNPEPHLAADGLAKRFGRRVLFRDLAFALGPGDSLAVRGANGSGKSTLLQIVAGVQAPSKGRVTLRLGGAEVADEARPLRVGFVAPYLQFYDAFTARENLAFIAQARRLPAGERLDALLDRVGLDGRGDDFVRTYSSGMRQRLRLAAALLPAPSVLLLDEPTATLDAPGRALVADLAAQHRADGGILVVATNVEHEAALCEQAVALGEV